MESGGTNHRTDEEGFTGSNIGQYRKFLETPPSEQKRSYCLGIVSFLQNPDHPSIIRFNPNKDGEFHEFLDRQENVEKRLDHGFNLVKVEGSENSVKAFEKVGQELHRNKAELGVKILISLNKTLIPNKMFKMEFTEYSVVENDVTKLAAQNNKVLQNAQGAIERSMLERADDGATPSESPLEMKPQDVFVKNPLIKSKGKPHLHYFLIRNFNEMILKLLNQVLAGDLNVATDSIEAPANTTCDTQNQSTPLIKLINFLMDILGEASGITSPWLYVGFRLSLFVLHTEDFRSLNSINYHIFGSPKKWYIIPPKYVARLEECFLRDLRKTFPNAPDCSVKHKQIYITDELLNDWEVGYFEVYQTVGTIIVTSWSGFHFGYNVGENVAIAVNAVLLDWKLFHREQLNPCLCLNRTKNFGESPINTKAVRKRKFNLTTSKKKQKNDDTVTIGLKEEERVESGNFTNKQIDFGNFCMQKGLLPLWFQDDQTIDFMMSIINLLPPNVISKLPHGFTGANLSALSYGDTEPELRSPITPEIPHSSSSSYHFNRDTVDTNLDITTTETEDYDEPFPSNNHSNLDSPSNSNASFIMSNQQQPLPKPKLNVNITFGTDNPNEIINKAYQLPSTYPNNDIELNFNLPNSLNENLHTNSNLNEYRDLNESHWMVDRDSDAMSSVSSALELPPSYEWPCNVLLNKPVERQTSVNGIQVVRPPSSHKYLKEGGIPYKFYCTCNKTFTKKDTLNRHIDRMVSKGSERTKPVPCQLQNCSSAFHLREDLMRHVRMTHKMNAADYYQIVLAPPIDARVNPPANN